MKLGTVLRPAALGAAGLLAVGLVGVATMSASAATIGTIEITPATGNIDSTVTMKTAALCPGGTNIQGYITGAGFPAAGQAVTQNGPQSVVETGTGYTVPLLGTLRDTANLVSPPVVYSGTYTLTLTCKNAFGPTTFGDFTNTLTFSNATDYTAASTPTPTPTVTVPSPSPTTTAPSPSPTVTDPSPSPTTTAPSPSPTTTAPSPSPTVTGPSPSPTGTPGGGASVDELLKVTVPAGSLVISAASTTVQLPELKLVTGFTKYATAGQMADVAVTDTRAGAPGFTVTGQVTPFTSGANSIAPSNLGWTPKVKSAVGTTATAGPVVAPGTGLGSPKTLATATGLGTAVLGADLALEAPVSTPAGDYAATLTITAI